jgi:hypothetical protein
MIIERHLRIGNFVARNDTKDFVVSEILGITRNFEWEYLINSRNSEGDRRESGWISAKKCDPIPLTPEWLERCGLKQKPLDPDDLPQWENLNMNIAQYTDGFYLYTVTSDPWHDQAVGKKIEFVHTLQNISLYLFGEELIIEL